jgi:glycosyltransferase involved in cell wall biosynthesis
MKTETCLLFDPIGFAGGSKIATAALLQHPTLRHMRVVIATCDPSFWHAINKQNQGHVQVTIAELPKLGTLASARFGWRFWLKQCCYALAICLIRFKFCVLRFESVIAASGPGVDMALYLVKPLVCRKLIQIIHGPIGASRSIGYALNRADYVFYLPSALNSIVTALSTNTPARCIESITLPENFLPFTNGLCRDRWPSACNYSTPQLFWCASLLTWKGLDKFTNSIKQLKTSVNYRTVICYIRPKQTTLSISVAPQALPHSEWHEQPANLDQIRQRCNIFVSTSEKEPFGLSILEAMAAGMCVVIPTDGAYWDIVLTDNQQCLKYQPADSTSLPTILQFAIENLDLVEKIGNNAKQLAQQYEANRCYNSIAQALIARQDISEPIGNFYEH